MRHRMEKTWHVAPTAALKTLVAGLDDETILSGPDGRNPRHYEISSCFASSFRSALDDFMTDMEIAPGEPGTLQQAIHSPLNRFASQAWETGQLFMDAPDDDIRIVGCDMGVLLLRKMSDPDHARISGLFCGSTLVIDRFDNLRFFGLGRDLVIARMIQDEWLPTWDHDKPGYSDAGAMTVRAARHEIAAMLCENNPSEGGPA